VGDRWWLNGPDLPQAPPPPTDPLKTMGITFTALGAAGLLGSSLLIATAKAEPAPCDPCGPVVCDEPGFFCNPGPLASSQAVAGSGLLGASLVTTLIGAPLWALGSLDEETALGMRSNDTTLLVGAGLTTVGAAAAAGGAFGGLATSRGQAQPAAIIAAISGTTMMLVGLPLWALGTRRLPPLGDVGGTVVRRSRGLMLGGISLTIVGATLMGAGAIMGALSQRDDGVRLVSGMAGFGGLGLALGGVPMWYVGQEKVLVDPWAPPSQALEPEAYVVPPSSAPRGAPVGEALAAAPRRPPARALFRPNLEVGPTSVALRFVF
jgi:hypothetical protein